MPPIIPAISAGRDVLLREEIEDAPITEFIDDPFTEIILSNPRLSPQTKAFIRASEKQRREQFKLEQELRKLRLEEERPGAIATLFGVPIGLQLGTASGMKGVPGLLVDIILDPVNLIAGVGTLSKLGRAARLLKGLSPAKKAEKVFEAARLIATAQGDDVLRTSLSDLAAKGDLGGLSRLAQANKLKRPGKELLEGIAQVDRPFADFLRNEKESLRALTDAFRLEDTTSGLTGARRFIEQFRTGERAFLRFGVPFFGPNFGELALEGVIKKTPAGAIFDEKAVTKLVDDFGIPKAQEAIKHAVDVQDIGEVVAPALGRQSFRVVKNLSEAGADALRVAEKAPDDLASILKSADEALAPLQASKGRLIAETSKTAKVSEKGMGLVLSQLLAKTAGRAVRAVDVKNAFRGAAKVMDVSEARKLNQFFTSSEGKSFLEQVKSIDVTERFLEGTKLAGESAMVGAESIRALGKTAKGLSDRLSEASKVRGDILESQRRIQELKRQAPTLQPAQAQTKKSLQKRIADEANKLRDLRHNLRTIESGLNEKVASFVQNRLKQPFDEAKKALANRSPAELTAALARAISNAAKGALKGKKFPELPALKQESVVEIAQDVLKGGVDESGKVTSATVKAIKEEAAARFAGSQEAGDIATFTSMREGMVSALKMADNLGETPKVYINQVGDLVNVVRNLPRFMANSIRVITRGDEDLLKRIFWDLDDPTKGFLKNAPDAVKTLRNEIATTLRTVGKMLRDEDLVKDLVQNYAPRITKVKNDQLATKLEEYLIERGVKRSKAGVAGTRFGKERFFETLDDLKEFIRRNPDVMELSPEVERIDNALEIYLRSALDAFTRKRVFKNLGMLPADAQNPALRIAHRVEDIAKLPRHMRPVFGNHYVKIDDTRLAGFVVHKNFANEIKAMFDRNLFFDPNTPANTIWDKFLKKVDWISNLGKSALFRLSFYHLGNLTVGALPGLNLFNVRQAAQFFRATYGSTAFKNADITAASFKALERVLIANPGVDGKILHLGEEIVDMMAHGVSFGRAEFGPVDLFDDFLKKAEQNIPLIRHPITGLRHLNKWLDGNLWEVWQNSMKAFYYQAMKRKFLLADKSLLDDAARFGSVKREIAGFANTLFGGQIWHKLLVTPKMHQFLRISLMAPDWNVSNILGARDLILNAPGIRGTRLAQRLTPDVMLRDVRFQLAMRYWTNTAIYAFLFGNAAQLAFTGRTLLDPDPEQLDRSGFPRIELPYHRYDGRKQYMDFLKQFVEPIEWVKPIITGNLKDLGEFIFPKLGTIPRTLISTVIGYNPGLDQVVYGDKEGPLKQMFDGLKEGGSAFVPISANQLFQVMTGQRDFRSAALSSIGFNVRSERRETFERRTRAEEIEALLEGVR